MNPYEYWALCDQFEAEFASHRARWYAEQGEEHEALWWQQLAAKLSASARRRLDALDNRLRAS